MSIARARNWPRQSCWPTTASAPKPFSRSYYAAFFAAEAALLHLGETKSKHSGVVAAIGQLLVRDRGVDEQAGRLLRSLFERRSQVDYGLAHVSDEEARRAVRDAETVVALITAWLVEQSS